eukprot:IDg20615t1
MLFGLVCITVAPQDAIGAESDVISVAMRNPEPASVRRSIECVQTKSDFDSLRRRSTIDALLIASKICVRPSSILSEILSEDGFCGGI